MLPNSPSIARLMHRALVLAGILALMAYAVWMTHRVHTDPQIAFLVDHGRAQWIRFDEPLQLRAYNAGPVVRGFRKTFEINEAPAKAAMQLRFFKLASVLLDGRDIYDTSDDLDTWKDVHEVDLAPHLSPGPHEIRLMVQGDNGPAAVWAQCEALGLSTGDDWEASEDGETWTPAQRSSAPRRFAFPRESVPFTPGRAICLAWLLPTFILAFLATLLARPKQQDRPPLLRHFTAARFRWLLLAAWAIITLNNLPRLHLHLGFDTRAHLEYIQYMADHWRVPLATEGWQMFQSPLYYALAALVRNPLTHGFDKDTLTRLIRLISLIAGFAQIEITYRTLKHVFPGRQDLQAYGALFIAFLPMNLYMSQYTGNEALAGAFSSLTILFAVRAMYRDHTAPSSASLIPVGLCFGLALLTKATAGLLVFPLALVAAFLAFRDSTRLSAALRRLATGTACIFGLAALIAGWYYARNWIELGTPFMGGWDSARGYVWWQDPGYRTLGQLTRFGDALTCPLWAGITSFWDGLYATFWADGLLSSMSMSEYLPPWRYGWMLAGARLALLPMAALLLGLARTAIAPDAERAPALLLAACCCGLHLLALLHLFMTVPSYCTVKAFYTLGILPCYALLSVYGFDLLTRHRVARACVNGLLACWAVSVCGTYFVM